MKKSSIRNKKPIRNSSSKRVNKKRTNRLFNGYDCSKNLTKNKCKKDPKCSWGYKLETKGTGGEMKHSTCITKSSKKDCIGRKKDVCVYPCSWFGAIGSCRPGNY